MGTEDVGCAAVVEGAVLLLLFDVAAAAAAAAAAVVVVVHDVALKLLPNSPGLLHAEEEAEFDASAYHLLRLHLLGLNLMVLLQMMELMVLKVVAPHTQHHRNFRPEEHRRAD